MAEDSLQYDTEQPEIQVDDHLEQEQQGPGDPPSKVLWEKMVKNKRYSFSYDDFQKEYNSKESIAKLHKELRGVGAKVVPINDFYAKYFPDLAGAKSSTTKPAQNEKPTAAGAQQQPVTSQTPKLAPQVFEKPITSQQYAPMDGIPAYGSPEYKKIKAAEAEKQSKQVAQQRAFQEFETAYDKFNIAKKNVDNGIDPDEQGVLLNGKPYSKAIGGKGVIENVSDFIIGDIVPSEAVKQEQERSRMQSKLLSYSSANEKALKTAQVYIDDITNEALKGYTRLSKISSVDGVHTPDPIKIRQYINNRAESAGFSKDGPVYDILNSKITAGVEYAIKKPTIEKNANEISKKETGKSIQELVSAEQQAIIQSAADINSKAKLQAETLAQKTISANKAEAQDLFNTKYKPLYDERNAISEQAASAFEKQFAHLIKDGKFIGSPQEYEMYNQQLAALQAIDDENKALTDSWSKELFKEQGRIASKYNKQYMAGISALEASTKKELAKKNEELKAFKVSPGLLTKINRYYEEAYKKTVTDEDAAKAPKGFLQTLSAFDSMFTHNFLDAMANYAGRMGLKGIESVFAAGANEFNPQQIEMNKFSDFLSPYKVIGSAATMGGRMGPAIAAGAITGAVTKNTGMAFRAFMAGANEWLTENTDNAHSTYKDVLAETGDPAKAENAAQKQYEAGMINLPLYGLGWMPFFSKSFNKLPLVAKIVAGTAIETGTELPTEFSQNLQEESIKKTGDWKNMLDYATWEKAKYTFYNIVPLSLVMGGGGHVVTHFADKVTYNQKVDALVQAAEIGGASASQQDQYAFNLVKIGDTKLAKAVLVGLHQSGRITDKELNRLNATVDKAKSITESAEKLGMNEGEQRIYAALNYQFEEAKANMATEKDPIAREAWKLKAANAQQNITNFAATKQGDYAIVTYADGGQSVFSHEEINNALSNPAVANSLAKGTLKIEVFGKEKEALAEKIKQATEVKKKSTASTSVVDEETESGNGDFSVEKVDAADGITQYLPTSSISGYFKDEQGEDISFTTEQEAKDFLSKQPKAQVPAMSTQSKKETLTKEQDEAKQRVATFIDNTVSLPTTDATLRERLENDPKAALQELIDFHEQQKSGKDEKTQVFHQKAIDKFEALKNDIDLINQQPQKSAETQKHDGSKSKDVESAIDGGKSQQPGQPQQNEVEIPNTPEASQLDEERKKAIAPLQAVAGGKATHTIQLPQRGKNTATILQNGREAGSIILTPEEQSLNDQKEAGREAGLVTDEEYNEWHKGFTAKVAARAIDATNKQYAKKQEALVNNPPSFLQRVKNLDLEAITDPIGRVLKYFALGGKINTNFVKEQYGGKDERIRQSTSTEEQRRSMFSLLAKDAPNIEKLAEQLESEANHHNDGNSRLDTRDYVRAIEEVLSSHQSPASAAKELWEKYSPEATEAEIAKLWEQKGGSQTQEESAPMEETEVLQPLTINGEEISFSADNSNPQTASQEPKLLTPNDPKFKRLQKAINRFLSKIKGYSTEVLHGQDFQKLVDWAKRQQDVSKEEGSGVGGDVRWFGSKNEPLQDWMDISEVKNPNIIHAEKIRIQDGMGLLKEDKEGNVYTTKQPANWDYQLSYEKGKNVPSNIYIAFVKNPSTEGSEYGHETASPSNEVSILKYLGSLDDFRVGGKDSLLDNGQLDAIRIEYAKEHGIKEQNIEFHLSTKDNLLNEKTTKQQSNSADVSGVTQIDNKKSPVILSETKISKILENENKNSKTVGQTDKQSIQFDNGNDFKNSLRKLQKTFPNKKIIVDNENGYYTSISDLGDIGYKDIVKAHHDAQKEGYDGIAIVKKTELKKAVDQSLKETPKAEAGSVGVGGDVESIKQIAKENGIEVVENKEGFKFKSGSREFQINHRGSKEDTIRKGVEKMIRLQDSESKRNQDSGYYTPLPLAVYDFVSKSGEQVDSIQYANNKTSAYIKLKNGKKIRISNHEPNTKSSDIELRYDQKTKEDYENEVLKAVEQSLKETTTPKGYTSNVEAGSGGVVDVNPLNDVPSNQKHNALKDILDKAQVRNRLDVSHKNGSHYWVVDGEYYRVADHTKPKGSFGEETYSGKKGETDFRNYDEFYNFLKDKLDLSDKTKAESDYKEEAAKHITKIGEDYQQPDGSKFASMDAALNNMWRLKKEIPKAVEQSLPTQEVKDNAKPTISKEQPDVKMMAGRKPVGGNSGYVGYSMSRRAAQAYDDGKQIFETEESDKEPKYFRRPNGTIYGIKVGTKIYLNGDKLNLETPAHEAGHIFRDWAKENAPDLYKAATKLMSRPNKYREMVLANETYKEQIRQMKANGATAEQINEFIADEALAHMIGDRAAKIVENRSQFVQWLKDLWESIKLSMPGAKDFENKTLSDFYKMTWEQFGNAATERILSGRALAQADSRETGDIRFMASGISNSNTIFEEDEKTQYYKTSEGEKIPYRVYDTGSKKDGNNASTNLLQRQENTEQGNDFALVERQFTEYKQLDFTAGTKIESLNDVAWLFHNLEDESVEHSFAVYIMPNGSYVVQHLSTGGIASTVIDGRLVSGNAVKMGAKSVAFVHNHPSGALRASNADMHVYSKLKKSLEGTGIDLQDGVIINLKSGKYVTFDAQSNAVNDITKQNQAQHKVQVLSFSKQVFAENYNPDKITGYSDVAMLLSTKKFGVSDKTEMLVLNNALEVVGKFVLPENNQYAKIIELLTQYGGVNAILYGNKINAEEVNDYNRRLVSIGFKISDAIEVKSDNYKSLVSEGLINEDQPLYESNSPSNTDNHEAAKKKTQGNRIEKSPLTGGKRKEIRHIIRDFKNAAKTRIFYTKVGRRAAGTYNSSEGAIRLRYAGDLDTTAHEAGHDIDDRYKVIEAILQNPAARAELVPFVASPAASKPPKGHPNPQNYLQREGFAEWLRAFIVNPDEAKAQAPEIYKIYEAQVHDNMKKAVQHFSNDVRTFAGLEGIDQLLSNVELTPETKSFFDRFKDKNHEGVFHISWVDKIKINMLNSLQAFDKAWNIAKGLKGIDEVLPENDPTILVRLLHGFDGKFGDILETGMINSKNEVLEDANGNAKNLDWLLEPLDRYNEKTIKKEQEYTIAFMVAERTLELSKRFGRESILSGIGGGLFKDIETAQAALVEINALPPAQKARIEEAARRYREFANDILQYMVDKGRLSKKQYDAIKKENVQYVAMQRIIDQEPGTELEVFTMNGNSIGSVAKPVHNIQGSSRTIINPYSSLLDGLYRSIKEADRNEILVAFTNMVSHIRSMGDGEVIPFSDIAIKGKPGDKNTQVVYHNGKPEYWIFQQDIHEAIKGLNEEAEGLLMKYGKIPGTILRETITKFPVFAARNFIRDTQDRIIKSSDSNLLDLVGNSAHWKDIARFGGLNSGFYMRDRASYYGLMKESMKRLAKNKNTIVLSGEGMKRVWDRYEKALQTSETINRVAEYRGAFREAKKKGMDDYNAGLYAASRARNLIDFAEAGVIMRQLNKLIPFSNAAVQGMRSAVNRAIEDPGGFAIRTGVYSVLPAVMLWMWNHRKDDDDDKENEYENLPAYQRDMYHNLKIGKNKWLSIPKPYELSLVSSGIDRGMSLFFGKNKNAFQGYGGTVIQSVMPLDESSMFGPFRPIYEGISNYDVFRQKNIVPIYENDLDLSLRHTETASLLGQWLQSASNVDARKIDHFIQGQFGYFGKAAMKLSNINREDGGRSFDITDLGFFKESPGYNSPDVQNLLNYAKRWGLTQNIDFKDIKALNQAIFDAKTDEEKEAAKKELITHSRLLLLQWKAEDKAKQKQDKFTEKQDTKSD